MVRGLTGGTSRVCGVDWDRSGAILERCGVPRSRTCRLRGRQLSAAVGARTGLDGARWRTRPPERIGVISGGIHNFGTLSLHVQPSNSKAVRKKSAFRLKLV